MKKADGIFVYQEDLAHAAYVLSGMCRELNTALEEGDTPLIDDLEDAIETWKAVLFNLRIPWQIRRDKEGRVVSVALGAVSEGGKKVQV